MLIGTSTNKRSMLISKSFRHLKKCLDIRTNLNQLLRFRSTTPLVDSTQCYEFKENGKTGPPATFLAFDLETTGLLTATDRVVELACRNMNGGQNSTMQSLVNPLRPIKNSRIHSITTSMVSQPGIPTFKELVPVLMDFVKSHHIPGKPTVLIAHKGFTFDFLLLENELQRCGLELPDNWRFLDSYTLSSLCIKGRRSLKGLEVYYGIPSRGQAHRAMVDVNVLCLVSKRLMIDLNLTPDDLMKHCITASQINLKQKQMMKVF